MKHYFRENREVVEYELDDHFIVWELHKFSNNYKIILTPELSENLKDIIYIYWKVFNLKLCLDDIFTFEIEKDWKKYKVFFTDKDHIHEVEIKENETLKEIERLYWKVENIGINNRVYTFKTTKNWKEYNVYFVNENLKEEYLFDENKIHDFVDIENITTRLHWLNIHLNQN